MPDSEFRDAVLRHLRSHQQALDALADDLSTAYDHLDEQLKVVQRLQKEQLRFIQLLGTEEGTLQIAAEDSSALPPFERDLVASYNSEEPSKWRRRFCAEDFGAENVNAIWEKGGEPRFTKKEGGIYSLVAGDGTFYVVPEPGLRLNEGYLKGEGLEHIFDISKYDLQAQPPVVLVRPATVEEASGRWRVVSKGEIRG